MFLKSGLSRMVRAMRGRLGRLGRLSSPNLSSPNEGTLTINNEESPAKRKSPGDECLFPVSIDTTDGQSKNIMEGHENVANPLEDDTPTLNNVESLKKGIIKTSKNSTNRPYTILLVGETGVGKSSVLEFIASVLTGNDIDHCNFGILDVTNEQGGSNNQSQTNSARLYEFTSKNGIIVRIYDTPGLVDTGNVQQDEIHNRRIATQIKGHIDSITAVLVLANGTIPRVTVGTDYALSALSAIFPKSLASNVAFMFTNVSSPLHWNFSVDNLPEVFNNAPRFLLDNPIGLQRKYLELENRNMTSQMAQFREEVKASEQPALEVLVDVFDWLDGLDRPKSQNIVANITDTLVRQTKKRLRKVIERGARKVRRI